VAVNKIVVPEQKLESLAEILINGATVGVTLTPFFAEVAELADEHSAEEVNST